MSNAIRGKFTCDKPHYATHVRPVEDGAGFCANGAFIANVSISADAFKLSQHEWDMYLEEKLSFLQTQLDALRDQHEER